MTVARRVWWRSGAPRPPQHVYQVGEGRFPPLRSVDAVPTNLPVVVTELIGRSDDRDRIAALLQRERLVTLTGVGGIGKTRLALAVAMGSPARDRAELCRYAADRRLLVVLDNCEHVLTDAARLAESLIRSGPEVFMLADEHRAVAGLGAGDPGPNPPESTGTTAEGADAAVR